MLRFRSAGGPSGPVAVRERWGRGVKLSNIAALLSDNSAQNPLWLLNNAAIAPMVAGMNRHLILTALAALLALTLAAPASADCYADYKAKKGDPLRLSYGVIQLSGGACASKQAAAPEISRRIAKGGWTLLTVVSIFGPDGLAQRKASAGANFLRY